MKRLILLTLSLTLPAATQDSAVALLPGQWEITTRMTELEMPGMPAEIVAQTQAGLTNQASTERRCITPEEAANPAANMVARADANDCEYTETTFVGGVVRIRATCQGPGGGPPLRVSLDGSYAAAAMDARIDAETLPGTGNSTNAIQMRLSGTMTGRRIGACAP